MREYARGPACAIEGELASMLIAADYPLMDVVWSMIIFFFWVIWIWIVITVLIDIFRRHDISGWAKAAWVVFVVILPWLGVLVYLIAQHDGMRERSLKHAQAQQQQFDYYVRDTAGGAGRRHRQGEGAARHGRDHAGGVRCAEGEGARVKPANASRHLGEGASRYRSGRKTEVGQPVAPGYSIHSGDGFGHVRGEVGSGPERLPAGSGFPIASPGRLFGVRSTSRGLAQKLARATGLEPATSGVTGRELS